MRRKLIYILPLVFAAAALGDGERVIYTVDSLYTRIIVSQTSSVRIMRFQEGPVAQPADRYFAQSAILLRDPHALYMSYARYSIACAGLVEDPERVLFVGLGAGSMPRFFAKAFPQTQVEVVEIDAMVVDVARRFFFLPELENMKITVMDGRIYIRQSTQKYDMIFLDAYRGQHIPFHLMTLEFLEEAKARLAPGGVIVSNIAVADTAQLYPWLMRTYQSAFPTLFRARVGGSMNKVLVGWSEPGAETRRSFRSKTAELAGRVDFGFDAAALAGHYEDVSSRITTRRVLTDDYAPVNLMWHRQATRRDWEY